MTEKMWHKRNSMCNEESWLLGYFNKKLQQSSIVWGIGKRKVTVFFQEPH